MTKEVDKTLVAAAVAFIPGVINAMLAAIAESVPVGGRFVKPAFWLLLGLIIFQALLDEIGLGHVLGELMISAGQGAVDMVMGWFAAAPIPVAAVVEPIPITVEEAVAALKAAAALGTDVPVVLTAQ